jgi:UDP-N-acetylmuramoyl-tripeptide--D-alanyl-D-alanine ligase
MRLSVRDLMQINHLEFRNLRQMRGRTFTGVSTDTRTLAPGNLFVALRGERTDGHRHLAEAFARGARAAVAEPGTAVDEAGARPILLVEDTLQALGDLARMHRDRFRIPVIAVAGSNGKTTTKDMIAAVLSTEYAVLSTKGNLNNHVGVPLTLFALHARHDIAVIEIGTNHPGEIARLCAILDPTHGVITGIGREHLEFFGTLDGVAREEGSLFAALRGRARGTAFVNADDPRVVRLAKNVSRKVTYGFKARGADIRGRRLTLDGRACAGFQLSGPRMKTPVEMHVPVPGEHNAVNALAAAAVGMHFRVKAKNIRRALATFRPTARRMEIIDLEGVVIFNDTYNANPDSMLASLRTLVAARVSGKKIAVLADMRELGEAGPGEHARIGAAARELGIDALLTFGTLARHMHEAARMDGAVHYEEKSMLAEYLAELIAPGDAVLIKGSRGMQMEDVVTFLEERLRSAVVPFG